MHQLPNDFRVLQWNMGCALRAKPSSSTCNSRTNLLIELIQHHQPAIVTLQEAPHEIRRAISLGYDIIDGPPGLALLINKSLIVSAVSHAVNSRSHGALLTLAKHPSVKFFATTSHMPVLWLDIEERRNWARRTALQIDRLRPSFSGTLEIHGGDFNLPPYDPSIVTDVGFHANRCISHASKNISGTLARRMYNPTWQVFGGTCGALGTHYLDKQPDGPWHAIDQILIDPKIMEGRRAQVHILTSTQSRSLAKRTGIPSADLGSDHFPLLVNVVLN